MEGQGSFGSWKEDRGAGKPGRGAEAVWVRSLGKKLEEDAVCSAHLLPAGLGLTPGHSLALVSLEQEEDVLSYALFEQVALKFFEYRKAKKYGIDADNADAALGIHNA